MQNFVVLNEVNGNVSDYARPELVYHGGEGDRSVTLGLRGLPSPGLQHGCDRVMTS